MLAGLQQMMAQQGQLLQQLTTQQAAAPATPQAPPTVPAFPSPTVELPAAGTPTGTPRGAARRVAADKTGETPPGKKQNQAGN